MEHKKFKSANGESVYLSSLSGHSVVLGEDFVEVPDCLWGMAYSLGALSEEMKVASVTNYIEEKRLEAEAETAAERVSIKEKMQIAYQEPILYLDAKNRLIQRKIISLLGKPIKRDLMDEIWGEIVTENESK